MYLEEGNNSFKTKNIKKIRKSMKTQDNITSYGQSQDSLSDSKNLGVRPTTKTEIID